MPLEVGRRHSLLCAHAYGEPTIPLHNNLFNCFVNDMKFNVLHHHLLTNGPILPTLARIKGSLKLTRRYAMPSYACHLVTHSNMEMSYKLYMHHVAIHALRVSLRCVLRKRGVVILPPLLWW